ncbi:MAG TPA: hypothetical protein PKM63_17355 [Panacibacter sp.]|nr:hypothetical protein [Panacibacter sp.]HNP46064.1 hypothetical protein [Panacibacter sp.]
MKMGLFSDLMDAIFSSGSSASSDPKGTQITESDNEIRVRNSDVIVDHGSGKHDTVWSNTTVNTSTGESKFGEGAHGPNYQK